MFQNYKFVKIYKNLHLLDVQLLIKSENKHKCCIYMIYNNINNKFYIGSAITNRINMRFRNHCIHGTGSKVINNSIKKYGLQNFFFIILEYFPGFVKKENLDKNHIKLLERETYYIEKYNPEYNILKLAHSSLGYKHTEDTKIKMRLNYSLERKEHCKNLNYNKKWTEERKLLFSKMAILRNKNNELRERLSKLLGNSIILYNKDNTINSEYNSIRQMSLAFKCCRKTINKAIKNKTVFKDIGVIKYKKL